MRRGETSPTLQRVVGVLALAAAGVLSLPLAAYFLDDQGTENWILPAQLLAMAAIGGSAAVALPALAPAGSPTRRRGFVGACWGLLAALIGVVVFWLLISGVSGA